MDKKRELQQQLLKMSKFMGSTCEVDPKPRHDDIWWAGDMPSYPEQWEAEDWQQCNDPIFVIWDRFLRDLRAEALETKRKELQEHYEQAKEVTRECADLLAASEAAAPHPLQVQARYADYKAWL